MKSSLARCLQHTHTYTHIGHIQMHKYEKKNLQRMILYSLNYLSTLIGLVFKKCFLHLYFFILSDLCPVFPYIYIYIYIYIKYQLSMVFDDDACYFFPPVFSIFGLTLPIIWRNVHDLQFLFMISLCLGFGLPIFYDHSLWVQVLFWQFAVLKSVQVAITS